MKVADSSNLWFIPHVCKVMLSAHGRSHGCDCRLQLHVVGVSAQPSVDVPCTGFNILIPAVNESAMASARGLGLHGKCRSGQNNHISWLIMWHDAPSHVKTASISAAFDYDVCLARCTKLWISLWRSTNNDDLNSGFFSHILLNTS